MQPHMKYNTTKQILEKYPLSRSGLYRLIKNGFFPSPIKIGRRSFWITDEVEAAMKAFADARA